MTHSKEYLEKRDRLCQSLLHKAWTGQSSFNPAQMMAAINKVTAENKKPTPPEHIAILAELAREDAEAAARGDTVGRAVKALNAIARAEGRNIRFKDNGDTEDKKQPESPKPRPPSP